MKREDRSSANSEHFNTSCGGGDLSSTPNASEADGQNIRETFAKNLRAWRTWRDLSMKVVASDVGVDESTYCLWEAGKRFPNAENLDAIAMYARVPICRFFKNTESVCGKQTFAEIIEDQASQVNPASTGL
jgi:DNA-binding XRE family transcriptional regulator